MENEGKRVLKHLDLTYVDEVFEQQKSTERGRPWIYAPSIKLKAFLYDLSEGKGSIHGVARSVQTSVAQVFLGLQHGGMSYATLERFRHQLALVVEQVFVGLARMIADLGILGAVHAVDRTQHRHPVP